MNETERKLLVLSSWWDGLPKKEREAYLKKHPQSKKSWGYKDFPEHKHFSHSVVDEDYSAWQLNKDGSPHVLLSKRDAKKKFKNKEDAHKFFYHPFYGLFPHEHDEAEVSKHLLKGNKKEIAKRYPNMHKVRLQTDMHHTRKNYTDKEIKDKFGGKPFDFHGTSHSDLDMAGGDAHDIVISDNPKAYDNYIES